MTREDAIKRLAMGFPGSIEEGKKYGQAVEMAISALSAEEIHIGIVGKGRTLIQPTKVSAEGEYINKSDTIDLIEKWGEDVLLFIDDLPTYSFPEREKGEWIPCSERLPEEDKEVLIFTKDKEINKAYHTLKEWSDTQWEWFVFGTLGYSLTYSDDEVLAWQPLPEPYKAEKGGE